MGRMALLLTGALAFSVISSAPATADITHHLINPGTIRTFCLSNNGTYWPDSKGHTYGCFWDESVIVCGGVNADQKHSCYESDQAPRTGPKPPWFHGAEKH